MNSVLIAEAIATAQKLTGKKVVDAEDMRLGLESLDLDEARLKELGLPASCPPLKMTAGPRGRATPSTWPAVGRQGVEGSGDPWFAPLTDIVCPMLEQAAPGVRKANPPLPARTEPCS